VFTVREDLQVMRPEFSRYDGNIKDFFTTVRKKGINNYVDQVPNIPKDVIQGSQK
jgi:hypothetical protein